jgi:hypothetical protein
MTTTYYASVNDYDTLAEVAHAGTSGTSTDVFEFRMGNGTVAPTRFQCLQALRIIERWITNGGQNGAGANLPPPTGSVGI